MDVPSVYIYTASDLAVAMNQVSAVLAEINFREPGKSISET